ncbi:MAG TPA: putative Ig domain-containing protein, partial [Vulgatibacter sp.]
GVDDRGDRVQMPTGFTFRFYDVTYSSVMVSSNGYLTFESASSGTVYSAKVFPNTSNPKDILAVWWGDAKCTLADAVRMQTLGTAPNRQVVIEWNCHRLSRTDTWRAQAWLTEGSSTMSVLYGTYASPGDYSSVTVGTQDQNAREYSFGLPCGGSCTGIAWPTNTRITYSQGPELSVAKVDAPREGFAGIQMPVTVTVRNIGGETAHGFGLRLLVSPVPNLTGATPIGTSSDRHTAEPGQSVTFSMQPRLPLNLGAGTYYIVAEADPDHSVPVSSRGSTVGASAPFTMGVPAPNLSASDVVVAEVVEQGEVFDVSWTAFNRGNAPALRAPYDVVLSTHDSPSASSFVLYRGMLDLEQQKSLEVVDQVPMPATVPTGRYYVGVILDPDHVVYEHDKNDNVAVSARILVSTRDRISIVTPPDLPDAELGAPYSVLLEASGGDGVQAWSVAPGSQLPPGLALVEEPVGAREAGLPYVTMLQGAPTKLGDFETGLSVHSGTLVDTRTFSISVRRSLIPLAIHSTTIPVATFDADYRVRLAATGGTAPYVWALRGGRLPSGLRLGADGVIEGRPRQDGSFVFTVRVTDSQGISVASDLEIQVVSPPAISCGTSSLPPHRISERFDEQLHAGGSPQPRWSTIETYFLASGRGEQWEWRNGEAPPGLVLSPDGRVTGAGTRAGSYEWILEVRDGTGGSSNRAATCVVQVEILLDRGMAILNSALPDAIVGQQYAAQLEASGGDGKVVWSLYGDSKLPAGLSLTADGLIAGVPTGAELAGEESGSVSFLVRASDPHNRVAVVALSILLQTTPPGPGPEEVVEESGCQAAGSGATPLWLGVLGLALLRRRRG